MSSLEYILFSKFIFSFPLLIIPFFSYPNRTIPSLEFLFEFFNPKGVINSLSEVILTFIYKKPEGDPLAKDIKCIKLELECGLKQNVN